MALSSVASDGYAASGRRTGPICILASLALIVAACAGALQPSGSPSTNTAPAASPAASISPSPIPRPTGLVTAAPSSSTTAVPTDPIAAFASRIAERFEGARSAGDWPTSWNLLSAFSRRQFGTRGAFATIEAAYNSAGGRRWVVAQVTRDPDILDSSLLGAPYDDAAQTADVRKAYLITINHPDVAGASAASEGLLVAPLPNEDWKVWIVH
jgi:hypothetical protein